MMRVHGSISSPGIPWVSWLHSILPSVILPFHSLNKKRGRYTPASPEGRREVRAVSPPRAWAEINLEHLRHNALELQRMLPSGCGIMAVVKANAYGHGSTQVAQFLNRAGLTCFAVAEIEEGISLRKHGVNGDILILGYTSPERASDLSRYRLTQTMVNREHGQALEERGFGLKVHVKVDTGMNRLGEPYQEKESILECYQFPHLQVTGTFSHLSMSDGLGKDQVDFTNTQLQNFDCTVAEIEAAGFDPGQLHIQSSYGILNYPNLRYDLVRPGIALYGSLSHEGDEVLIQADLRPVLSLKATVTQVKDVEAHHSVGYGFNFIPPHDIKIATISIGYADGIPRLLSDHGGYVLIRGKRASIIGSICMDQLTIDVTSIDGVTQGDTVTLIGQDGADSITASQIAGRCGTVANEILSRLGSRVERVFRE